MDNVVTVKCPNCGSENEVVGSEDADDHTILKCRACGQGMISAAQLRAKTAQQAAGIGASDLADDHVPLGGPPFGSTT